MLQEFNDHIQQKKLFTKKDKLILAMSGGVDSAVLAHLLQKSGFNFSIAHCNFKLRGKDSNADAAFCKNLANTFKVPFYVKKFNTKQYRKKNGISTQMAARDLRYAWFKELLESEKANYLLTAHHANDVVETIIINLLRGTGIKGLKGIEEKKGNVARPLLPFNRQQIKTYAKKNKIEFREDKSNSETYYERNFIRLNIVPQLKKLNPELEQTFFQNAKRFKEQAAIVEEFLELKTKSILKQTNDLTIIDKQQLKQEPYKESLLHYILSPFGFNSSQQKEILANISSNGLVGKLFKTKNYSLSIDREKILLSKTSTSPKKKILIKSLTQLSNSDLFLVKKITEFELPLKNELLIAEKKLIFPLTLRGWKTGDKFKPFGMKGFKLLSDFFKDQKLNLFEKENIELLVNGNKDIIWVCGYRSDERYRVREPEKKLLKLVYGK